MASMQCTSELASANKGPVTIITGMVMLLLACIAVGIRFYCRRLAGAGWWYDDWTIVLALFLSGAYTLSLIPACQHGVGRHLQCVGVESAVFFLKLLLSWGFLYILIMMTVKYSILLFLWRLFKVHDFRKWFWMLWIAVTVWGVSMLIASGLQCRPLSLFWNRVRGIPYGDSCFDTANFFVANAIPHIIIDFALLVLPMPWIARLHLPRSLRYGLLAVFGCGAIVVAVSCYRLKILTVSGNDTSSRDITYYIASSVRWTVVENNLAIVSACLPSMAPLIRRLIGFIKRTPALRPEERILRIESSDPNIYCSRVYSVHSINGCEESKGTGLDNLNRAASADWTLSGRNRV